MSVQLCHLCYDRLSAGRTPLTRPPRTSLLLLACVCFSVHTDAAFKAIGVPPLPAKDALTAILQNHVIGGVAADSAAVIAGGNKDYTTLSTK